MDNKFSSIIIHIEHTVAPGAEEQLTYQLPPNNISSELLTIMAPNDFLFTRMLFGCQPTEPEDETQTRQLFLPLVSR